MAITLEGSLYRIRMPDGTYLQFDSGHGGSPYSFYRIGALTIFHGTVSINGATTVQFPYTFPNACTAVVCHEANASGWAGPSVGIFGSYARFRSSCVIRCDVKSNGGIYTNAQNGQTANFVAIGY